MPRNETAPTCKTCDTGSLKPRRMPRLDRRCAILGHVIMWPAFVGMALVAMFLVATTLAAGAASEGLLDETVTRLQDEGFSDKTIAQIAAGGTADARDIESLLPSQAQALLDGQAEVAMGETIADAGLAIGWMGGLWGIGSGLLLAALGAALCSGKGMLQCTRCRAAVPAS